MTVGERIKKIRLSKGLTLDEISKKLGYSNRSAFYKIETEDNGVTIEKLKKIADILEVSLDDLLYDDYNDLDVKEVLEKAEKANMVEDILYAVYHIHKETYYDMAIVAPTWYPEKIFNDDDIINLLMKGPCNSSYEVYHNDLKIAYIQCGIGASNLTDAMLCLTNANIKNIYFFGSVGSLKKELEVGSVVTPSECISFDGVASFFKIKIDKKTYGSSIIPYNMNNIDKMIELAKLKGITVNKAKVFCTNSIMFEYSHMDEILASGSQLIEMETAAFYSCLKAMNKNGIALLVVSDNLEDNKRLVAKNIDDKNKYHFVRRNTLKELISLFENY